MESHLHWATLGANVLQASGMVSVQAECGLDDALRMMRDRGLVQHQSLTEIADAVIDRKIRFGF